ncbi:hypothetical protein [Microbacterium flavum]|uniref:Uncharacterized protein n=1 Tax=Microbacterium flavum TaxID=415216 RepID=A0ABS5XSY0_9MICO|nr:hypothetical protein [Microbacterium flavum]MBT8797627.1 hypothetical protein [Microbacterium flavum]
MARVGGRNAVFAWIVGVLCLAVVGVLAFLAIPLIPASVAWMGDTVNRPTGSAVADGADGEGAAGVPTECSGLYDSALWATMRFAPGSVMTPSADAPTSTAQSLVTALQPQVLFTCSWHADAGTVSTTLATVPTDAGAIAAAALPAAGFTCEAVDDRTRCARTDGELVETIEAGGGLWLSTSESAWHPAEYVRRTGDRVWG